MIILILINMLIQVSAGDLLEAANIVLGNRSVARDVDTTIEVHVDAWDDDGDLEDADWIKEAIEDSDPFEEDPPNVSIHVHRSMHT